MMRWMSGMVRAVHAARSATQRLDFVPPLLARTTLGVVFMSTGWGKVHALDRVTQFFSELGIPAPAFNAVLVSWTELVGGALLLVGLGARMAALPLAISMTVAILTAKAGDLHGLADLFGTVEFTYLVLLIGVAIAGPGRCSLDACGARLLRSSAVRRPPPAVGRGPAEGPALATGGTRLAAPAE